MADSERQILLDEEKKLMAKRERIVDRLEKLDAKIDKNRRDLGIFNNPAYGARFIEGGSRNDDVTKEQKQEVFKQIQTLPVSQAALLQVKKTLIAANHDNMLKCLEFSPDGYSFVTTCSGGKFNMWDCKSVEDPSNTISVSIDQRGWAEDIAFFPSENRIVAVFKSKNPNQQIALISMDPQTEENEKVTFLSLTREFKGGLKRVIFPDTDCFITASENRSVDVWKNETLTPILCHKTFHTNDITGICGLMNKNIVLSTGLDRSVIGYDYVKQMKDSNVKIKKPCLGIKANPVNENLLVIQTRDENKQLVLLDYRQKLSLFDIGWNQAKTTQSELVSTCWSPSGLLLSTGSSDKEINVFDIRVIREDPALIIKNAHTSRVFKADWHLHQPKLISISADHLLGYHNLTSNQ